MVIDVAAKTKLRRRYNNITIPQTTVSEISHRTMSSSTASSWKDCSDKLSSWRNELAVVASTNDENIDSNAMKNDIIFEKIQDCMKERTRFQDRGEEMKEETNILLEKLSIKTDFAKARCQEASQELYQLTQDLQRDQQCSDRLIQEVKKCQEEEDAIQREILSHQEDAEEEFERIDLLDEEMKMRVPRMKKQISLYANSTGIKWYFHEEEQQSSLLVGHVVRQNADIRHAQALYL